MNVPQNLEDLPECYVCGELEPHCRCEDPDAPPAGTPAADYYWHGWEE
jgi:hypothetical protein